MPKSTRGARRKPADAVARNRRIDLPIPATADRDSSEARDPRVLLERIVNTPHLARIVPRLRPEVLHRIIQTCGLEECGDLVALATPAQLTRVFDLDLWRAAHPGRDERLDADRFTVWLEVLMETGATAAAETLAGIDAGLIVAALAPHLLVFDRAAVSTYRTLDGEQIAPSAGVGDGLSSEIGPYMVVAKREDAWDTIVGALQALDAQHPDAFGRVMRGCRALSNSAPEADGLDDLLGATEQEMFDVAVDREQRGEEQGYVTPAQARAFLQMARDRPPGPAPTRNPIVAAYFRALEAATATDSGSEGEASGQQEPTGETPADADGGDAVAAVMDILLEAGVAPQPPRALIGDPHQPSPLARLQAHMRYAAERDDGAFSTRTAELAFLANTLLAGCSIQARPLTPAEASDAAAAVCNLGLENWPTQSPSLKRTEDVLIEHDLVSVFQVGWNVLYRDVCMYAAEQLIDVLNRWRCVDRDIQLGLDALRRDMMRHCRDAAPWRARDALDAIVLLDMPAWAALLGLIDECPVMHAALAATRAARTYTVSASAFEFISENRQIASVRNFMASLPDILALRSG